MTFFSRFQEHDFLPPQNHGFANFRYFLCLSLAKRVFYRWCFLCSGWNTATQAALGFFFQCSTSFLLETPQGASLHGIEESHLDVPWICSFFLQEHITVLLVGAMFGLTKRSLRDVKPSQFHSNLHPLHSTKNYTWNGYISTTKHLYQNHQVTIQQI